MQLIYVDDILWLVGDKGGVEKLFTVIFYYSVLGLQFAQKKFSGGHLCRWVGFELTLAERALGLTEGRAKWIVSWVSHTVGWRCYDGRPTCSAWQAFVRVHCTSKFPPPFGPAVWDPTTVARYQSW